MRLSRPMLLIPAAGLLVSAAVFIRIHSVPRLPWYAHFDKRAADQWTAYGGTWEAVNGSMRNDSDDRGAKLLAGSTYWRDYTLEADVQLLGSGDAGLIVRGADAESGVDSYTGYYAGLRTMDDSLVVGLVQHGWQEFPASSMPGGVQPFRWYHLAVTVSGCRIDAVASIPRTSDRASFRKMFKNCFASGRVGLRSYSSGGVWRNVVVKPISDSDAPTYSGSLPPPDGPSTQRSILASYVNNDSHVTADWVSAGPNIVPAASLRYVSPFHPPRVAVRGVVVLKTPELYVQDATGGVAVAPIATPTLKIGDEVEVTGLAQPHGFSASLSQARIRLLWESSPGPPLSVTANQAATGAYDAMFIELEGSLIRRSAAPSGAQILDLENGSQTFRALLNPGRSASHLRALSLRSMLRLRGICVLDPEYTHNVTPFVLLVRSTEDVEVVAGPPWWSPDTLIPGAIVLLGLAAVAYIVSIRARHWRLHAIVEERSRLAHEIHDTLAQSFAGIAFQLQAIRNSMPTNVPRLEQQVLLACDLVRHSHEEARRSIRTLRPETLESEGLAPALKIFAERMLRHGSVAVHVTGEGTLSNTPLRIKDTLFRIGQEAIANSIRHASATRLEIHVAQQRSSLRLRIRDNGCGFQPNRESRGFGLIGMQRRADSISAAFQLRSAPGCGTQIEIIAPLPAPLTLFWRRLLWHSQPSHAQPDNPYSYSG